MRVRFMIIVLTITTLFTYSLAFPTTRSLSRTASNRIALVIGNGDYAQNPLRNPINDANAIATVLKELGFNVTLVENANLKEMEEAANAFETALKSGEVGLFYYSGHGMQIDGSNYLLPVHERIGSKTDIHYKAFDAGRILAHMEAAKTKVNIVILDACRDNPYRSLFRSIHSQGLTPMNAPHGSLIAYSTGPGNVAEDGSGNNSPYTRYLVKALKNPIPVERIFKMVRENVMAETNNEQVPWESSCLTGDFYFTSKPATLTSDSLGHSAPPDSSDNKEIAFWGTVSQIDSIEMYEAYLEEFPKGTFAKIAHIRLTKLKTNDQSPPQNEYEKKTGLTLRPLSSKDANTLGLQRTSGLLVIKVEQGSPAEESDVLQGDVILEANQQAVSSVEKLQHILKSDAENIGAIMLRIKRQQQNIFRTIALPDSNTKPLCFSGGFMGGFTPIYSKEACEKLEKLKGSLHKNTPQNFSFGGR